MWTSSKTPPHLPPAEGPYIPGCMDVMLDYSASGTLARLFYPTKAKETTTSKWITWLPGNHYLDGMARAIFMMPWALRLVNWWYSSNLHVPILYGEKANTDKKLKCIIISHGYAACRFLYSFTCSELASRGYLVAVIEHRDRTANCTYYYKSKEDAQQDNKTIIYSKGIRFGQGHYENRNEQVHQRTKECSKLLDFLINLNKGVVPHNVLDDVKSEREINFKLADLVGRIDTDTLTMAGHSFGGATTLLTLSARKELKQGILLDPWMFPIKAEEELPVKVTQPVLFINTQTFHILSNVNSMEKFLSNKDSEMYTILHTTHESQTDTGYVMGFWLNWFMTKLKPVHALKINNALMLRFLKKHTGQDEDIEDCESYLKLEQRNIDEGLTKPWA